MAWSETSVPHELLDDGFPPDPCDLLVIGCGNILRGDDAAGPILIRELYEREVPAGVRLVDGGTSGMDVAFAMRGAARVVIVDASATGTDAGTVYRVPAEEVATPPPLSGLHSHNFRWDHALSLGAWLLGPHCPSDITVFLIEGATYEPGEPLTEPVAAAMRNVADLIVREFYPPAVTEPSVGSPHPSRRMVLGPLLGEKRVQNHPSTVGAGGGGAAGEMGAVGAGGGGAAGELVVEITDAGYLHLPVALAAEYIPSDAVGVRRDGDAIILLPLASAAHGGRILKQRNLAGDRSVLLSDLLPDGVCGEFPVTVDPGLATLTIDLGTVR